MSIRSAKKRLMAGILAVLQIAAPCELSGLVAEAAQQRFARGDVLVGLDAMGMEPVNDPQDATALRRLRDDDLHGIGGRAVDAADLLDRAHCRQRVDGVGVAQQYEKGVTGAQLVVGAAPAHQGRPRRSQKARPNWMPGTLPRLELIWADNAYVGPVQSWVWETLGWRLQIVERPGGRGGWMWADQEPPTRLTGFQLLPRRWVLERTFVWIGRNRWMSQDYQFLPATSEAWIYLSMIRLILRRLAHEQIQPVFHYRRVA